MRLCVDIEGDNLIESVTVVHCICTTDLDTGEDRAFGPNELDEAERYMEQATELVAHNGLTYDFPALKKVRKWVPPAHIKIRDTLVESRLKHSDIGAEDDEGDEEMGRLRKSHSLEAWGVRLGIPKLEFEGPWDTFSPEMLVYCQGDTRLGAAIANHMEKIPTPPEALQLEMDFAWIADQLHLRGFDFDSAGAEELCKIIEADVATLVASFKQYVPDTLEYGKKPAMYYVGWPDGSVTEVKTKKEADEERKKRGLKIKEVQIVAGKPKAKTVEFNLNSRPQCRQYLLEKYNFISPTLTDTGEKLLKEGDKRPYDELAKEYGSIPEDMLRTLDYPEAAIMADYQLLKKRLGQIRDGDNGWLKLVRPEGSIHHNMIPIGAATMRCAHYGPNLGQVPHVLSDKKKGILYGMEGRYGVECRRLFRARPGFRLVGTDLSGIEGRLLAHFLKPFDKGAYIDQVLSGDVHQLNADSIVKMAGFGISRGDSKSPFYGFLYGIGAEKQGKTVVPASADAKKEFQSILKDLTGGPISEPRAKEIASMIRWGVDSPVSSLDERYQKLVYSVKKIDNLQRATWAAYSAIGGRVNNALGKGINGMQKLLDAVKKQAQRGYLQPMDGRRIPVRSEHAALNTLLQGSAAIIMKKWAVLTWKQIQELKMLAFILAIIHDEIQSEVGEGREQEYADVCVANTIRAGKFYRLSIPLSGEAKIGDNWFETH